MNYLDGSEELDIIRFEGEGGATPRPPELKKKDGKIDTYPHPETSCTTGQQYRMPGAR